VRLLSTKDLFLNQAALTGESMPVEKLPAAVTDEALNPLEMPNLGFLVRTSKAAPARPLSFKQAVAPTSVLWPQHRWGRQLTSFDKGLTDLPG